MWLREIRAAGFRAFSEVSWEFPKTGLVFVAGANNSGKSSLLATLDAIVGSEEGDPAMRKHSAATDPPTLHATFMLNDIERSKILQDNGLVDTLDGSRFRSIEFIFSEIEGSLRISSIDVEWLPGEMRKFAYLEPDIRENRATLRMLSLPPNSPADMVPGIAVKSSFVLGIALESATQYSPELAEIWRGLAKWRSSFFHFRALRMGTSRSTHLASEPNLAPSGVNLPAVLLDLTTNRPGLMNRLRELISEIVPDVGNLETPTSGNSLEIAFSDPFIDGFRHNLKELGTGVEQLLMTIVVGLTQKTPCTLVIEEPETNLHPAAQRAMLGLLREWSADRLIVAATHSPVMLDRAGGQDRVYHVTRASGSSVASLIDSAPLNLFESLGVRLSDVLSADRILVVEGPSDEEVLAAWFPEYLRDPRLAVISGGGGDSARHAGTLATWLDVVDRIGERNVVFMRDRDELSPESITLLERSPTVYVLQRRELENYLLDPESVAQLLATLPSVATAPEVEDVRAAILDAANDLRPVVIVNRVVRHLQPVRLMDNKLRQNLAKRRVGPDEIKREVTRLIPDAAGVETDIDRWWAESKAQVDNLNSDEILRVAPGEEILDSVFMKFAKVHFKKRAHAPELAKMMQGPPEELRALLADFMKV
ncbi:AAA family ATPase [Kitasatospora sp. NPDC051914]|uniref:AAA family ATPase n=1 Tax=Kitasatospora sp. NPDC051914 TaxID=3154945 RepID=UPI0034132689